MSLFQHPRGMPDGLPADTPTWTHLQNTVIDVLERYGYQEIRLPFLEVAELFSRSVGESTDVVQKEMYVLEDRSGHTLALRPEGTAGCVRAGIQHGLLYRQQPRLWYMGPMFRYERPQKGRQRQFHQIGAEAFGFADPQMDVEMLAMSSRLLHALGLKNLSLVINTLGTPESRAQYREALLAFLTPLEAQLDEDSKKRLQANPLRILDSKSSDTQALLADAPMMHDYLDADSQAYFKTVCDSLTTLGIEYQIDATLVRGLDYYTHTVFEWQTDQLGAQNAVCAGGRYDGLVEQLGGKPTPGIGFAMGLERLVELLRVNEVSVQPKTPLLQWIVSGAQAEQCVWPWQEACREAFADDIILSHAGGGSFKSQMKRADKSGAKWAAIVGEDEAASQSVTLKPMLTREAQQTVPADQLIETLQALLNA